MRDSDYVTCHCGCPMREGDIMCAWCWRKHRERVAEERRKEDEAKATAARTDADGKGDRGIG